MLVFAFFTSSSIKNQSLTHSSIIVQSTFKFNRVISEYYNISKNHSLIINSPQLSIKMYYLESSIVNNKLEEHHYNLSPFSYFTSFPFFVSFDSAISTMRSVKRSLGYNRHSSQFFYSRISLLVCHSLLAYPEYLIIIIIVQLPNFTWIY